MDRVSLSQMEFDALKELGNIGTGNAATALSRFVNKNVDMNIPETKFVPLGDFAAEVGGAEQITSGIYLQLTGDMQGEALFLFPQAGAMELVDIMMGREAGTKREMDEMDLSAFKEMSNILTGAFLTALAEMLDAKIIPSVPHVATDIAQSLLDFILIKVGEHADELFFIKTKINVEGHNINGDFFIVFDKPSLERMVTTLHKQYGTLP